MTSNQDHQPVTRHEFNNAIKHLENVLAKQTEILQVLAVSAVENKGRDEKLAVLFASIVDVRKEQDTMRQKFAWLAGAGAALTAVWPVLARKLGLM